jgi:hypothetical protein
MIIDSHLRPQISMLAHQIGIQGQEYRVPSKTSFGLWEWDTLRKECGFER